MLFERIIKQETGLHVESEYRFHPIRKWRFDYAIVSQKIAIEVEGGCWVQGRHTRGKGFINDIEKYNVATSLGWKIFRVIPGKEFEAIKYIREAIECIARH